MATKKTKKWGGIRPGSGRPKLTRAKIAGAVYFPPLIHDSITKEAARRGISFSKVAVERITKK